LVSTLLSEYDVRRFQPLAVLLSILTVLTPIAVLRAQHTAGDGEVPKGRVMLAPLQALVGRWEGEASVVAGRSGAVRVRQSEDVVWGAGQTVLMIRGTGRAKDSDHILFEAAAILWYDPDADRLRMRAHRAEGVSVDADVELKKDTLVWGFPANGGRVRYTLAFDADEWHETGQFLRPDGAPVPILEMRLRRARP
jgi:hypothetical protein